MKIEEKYLDEAKVTPKKLKSDANKLYQASVNLIKKVNSWEDRDRLSNKTKQNLTKLLELVADIEDDIKKETK